VKRLIIATMLISTGAMAQSYEIPSIEQMTNQPILSRGAVVLPVAPVSRTGPTTVWQSGNYTYIDEPRGQTTVFQNGSFTYINQPNGQTNMCQTIGQFTYCN
jgi:hypothetical protein